MKLNENPHVVTKAPGLPAYPRRKDGGASTKLIKLGLSIMPWLKQESPMPCVTTMGSVPIAACGVGKRATRRLGAGKGSFPPAGEWVDARGAITAGQESRRCNAHFRRARRNVIG